MHHSQTVRQSRNYQSAEVSFGMTAAFRPENLGQGIRALEDAVEEQLVNKVKEQKEALVALAT